MYLVSVYFDEKSTKNLQRYINMIAEKTGNTFMTDNKVPPHMTISSIEARGVDVLIPTFEVLGKSINQGKIQFVSIGQLLPYVMFATPVLNEYLMELQLKVYDAFARIPETAVSRFYQPYSWLPHVTLGKKLDEKQMAAAFEVLRKNFAPFEAVVTDIGLAKVNPHEDVRRFGLVTK